MDPHRGGVPARTSSTRSKRNAVIAPVCFRLPPRTGVRAYLVQRSPRLVRRLHITGARRGFFELPPGTREVAVRAIGRTGMASPPARP